MLRIQERVGIQILTGNNAAFSAMVKAFVLAALGNMAFPIKGVSPGLHTSPTAVGLLK